MVLERFPHYYILNFILPMSAITVLTMATMWMGHANLGARVNSGTKMLLCVVSIEFVTARARPAIHGDIWLDRFQSHCLVICMSAVLESLLITSLARSSVAAAKRPQSPKGTGKVASLLEWLPGGPHHEAVDAALRGSLVIVATLVLVGDIREVEREEV